MRATSKKVWEVESQSKQRVDREDTVFVLADSILEATKKGYAWLDENDPDFKEVVRVTFNGEIDVF